MACLDCTQMISDISDPYELCQSIVAYLHQTLFFERTSVIVIDKATRAPLVFAHSSDSYAAETLHNEVMRINQIIRPPANGVVHKVLQTGRERLVQNISECPDYLTVASNIEAEACFPIMNRERCIGVLNVEHTVKNAFSHDDLMLLKIVSVGLSSALKRAHKNGARGLSDSFHDNQDRKITA